jgi:hypothetical protein
MQSRASRTTFALGIVLVLSAAATCEPCDTPRVPWMDSLKSSGIKSAGVAVDFDLFPDGHLALRIKDIQYYNDYVMNSYSKVRSDRQQLPEAWESQLREGATKAMEQPLRKELAEKHVTQGRGDFSYPLYDDPCQHATFFGLHIFGPTPLAIRPAGKRLAVISDVAATSTFSGKAQTRVHISTDDGWVYICRRSGNGTLPFHQGENVVVVESNEYLTIESLEPNAHRIRLKMAQKTRFFYL